MADEVRRIDSAPSAQARAQADHEASTLYMADQLNAHGYVKLPVADEDERALFRSAAHAAGTRLGIRITTRAIRDGAMMAAPTEDPSPLKQQLDTLRSREAMNDAVNQWLGH